MLIWRSTSKNFKKFKFESRENLITAKCTGRVIKLKLIEEVVAFVLFFKQGPKIRSTFYCSLKPYPRVKTRKSIYLKNINPNNLTLIFFKIVSEGLYCDKVWGISN